MLFQHFFNLNPNKEMSQLKALGQSDGRGRGRGGEAGEGHTTALSRAVSCGVTVLPVTAAGNRAARQMAAKRAGATRGTILVSLHTHAKNRTQTTAPPTTTKAHRRD
jgi:hypothetical protein